MTPFKRVIGIDPSEKMVEQARLAVPQNSVNRIEFARGSAEDLSMLPDSSVDLVTAGSFFTIKERRVRCSYCPLQRSPLTGSTGIRCGQKSLEF